MESTAFMDENIKELLFNGTRDIFDAIFISYLDIRDLVRLDRAIVNAEERNNYLEMMKDFHCFEERFFLSYWTKVELNTDLIDWILVRNLFASHMERAFWQITANSIAKICKHLKKFYYFKIIEERFQSNALINFYGMNSLKFYMYDLEILQLFSQSNALHIKYGPSLPIYINYQDNPLEFLLRFPNLTKLKFEFISDNIDSWFITIFPYAPKLENLIFDKVELFLDEIFPSNIIDIACQQIQSCSIYNSSIHLMTLFTSQQNSLVSFTCDTEMTSHDLELLCSHSYNLKELNLDLITINIPKFFQILVQYNAYFECLQLRNSCKFTYEFSGFVAEEKRSLLHMKSIYIDNLNRLDIRQLFEYMQSNFLNQIEEIFMTISSLEDLQAVELWSLMKITCPFLRKFHIIYVVDGEQIDYKVMILFLKEHFAQISVNLIEIPVELLGKEYIDSSPKIIYEHCIHS
jgi:hypothetical protein